MEEIGHSPEDFAGAFEAAFARFQVRVEEACAISADWPTGVAASIRVALEFAAAYPDVANTLVNEAMAAGPDGIARRERLLAYASEALSPGRGLLPEGVELPPVTEHALVGGVAALIGDRLARGRAADLPGLASDAIQFVLTPYLGASEANRVAASARPGPGRDR